MTATVFAFVVSFLFFICIIDFDPVIGIEIILDMADWVILIVTKGQFWSIDEFCRWAELSFGIVTPDPRIDPMGFTHAMYKIKDAMDECKKGGEN